jgi:hypothetical protein
LLIPPTRVQTLGSIWQSPRTPTSPLATRAVRVAGVAGLFAVIAVGVAVGTGKWQQNPYYPAYGSGGTPAGLLVTSDSVPKAPGAPVRLTLR